MFDIDEIVINKIKYLLDFNKKKDWLPLTGSVDGEKV